MSSLLKVMDLNYTYPNGHEVLKKINFSLEKGEVLSIIGPNGAGKSTLLNCLTGVVAPTSGTVKINDNDMLKMKIEDVAKLVGYMQQSVDIVYDYTVMDIVLMGRAPYISTTRLPGKDDVNIAKDALNTMGISEFADRIFTQLSGGEKQQVLIARLLAQQPSVIVMDEPTSALDYGNQRRTVKMIEMLSKQGFTIIMTTHNPDQAMMLGGKVGAINKDGNFVVGSADEMLNSKFLTELYGENIAVTYVEQFGRKICSCI